MAATDCSDPMTQKIIQFMRQLDKPYATTKLIQGRTDKSDQWVRDQLESLEEKDLVKRDKVGRHWVYWLPDYNYSESR